MTSPNFARSTVRRSPFQPYSLSLAIILLASAVPVYAAADDSGDDTEVAEPTEEPPAECATYIAPEQYEDAQALVLHGVNCFEAEEFDWALTYYTAAYALTGDAFLLAGMGRSLHELGLFTPAATYYSNFLDGDEPPSGADRIRNRIRELDDAMVSEGATISLTSSPSGASVYLVLENGNWHFLGRAPLEMEVRQGHYEFVFDDTNYLPRRVDLHTERGEHTEVAGHLISETSGLSISQRRRRRAGALTATAGLGIGAAGGALFALSARNRSSAESLQEGDFPSPSDYDERLQNHLDSADRYGTFGTIAAATGFTVLITGALLYFSGSPSGAAADDQAPPESIGLPRLEAAVSPRSLGLRLRF